MSSDHDSSEKVVITHKEGVTLKSERSIRVILRHTMGARQSAPEPPPPEPILTMPNVLTLCGAVAILAFVFHGAKLSKHYSKLAARGKRNIALSTVGMLASMAACVVEPNETYLSVDTAINTNFFIFTGFSLLFLFGAEFFFADNFTVKPKDNFGLVFTRMFGFQGLWTLWLAQNLTTAQLFPMYALFNAGIIFIGPHRGEMLLPANEKHVVPHIGTAVGGLVMLAALP